MRLCGVKIGYGRAGATTTPPDSTTAAVGCAGQPALHRSRNSRKNADFCRLGEGEEASQAGCGCSERGYRIVSVQ